MEPIDLPAQQPEAPTPDSAPSQAIVRSTGFRRSVLTAGMAAALLVAGGVAVVSAASPDPSASPTPVVTTEPSTNGSTSPSTTAQGRDAVRGDCPLEDGVDGEDGATSTTPTPTS